MLLCFLRSGGPQNTSDFSPFRFRYKAAIRGVDSSKVVGLPLEERNRVNLPTLLVVGSKDCVTRPEAARQSTAKWVKDVRVEELDCGHWIQLEEADRLNSLLIKFADEVA